MCSNPDNGAIAATTQTNDLGTLLRKLRGTVSLRQMQDRTGISHAYLSKIEKGRQRPGPRVLQRLASAYGVGLETLLREAGHLDYQASPSEYATPPMEVERCYQFVMADARFMATTKPSGELTLETKRFIVEMYQELTGKTFLK